MAKTADYIDFSANQCKISKEVLKMSDLFAKYIENPQITFKYAKGNPAVRGKEFHLYHELVFFLNGDSDFISENFKCRLSPETFIIIPKEKYHHFDFKNGSDNYLRCTINFNEIPDFEKLIAELLDDVKVIKNPSLKIIEYFNRLINAVENPLPDYQKEILLKLILGEILLEISNTSNYQNRHFGLNELTEKVIRFINNHFQEKISVSDIARTFNVSSSTLSHTFKKDLKTSVYRYILNKRLITARKMITEGTDSTIAAHKCGFDDYSGFYKAYLKYFACSPTQDKNNPA